MKFKNGSGEWNGTTKWYTGPPETIVLVTLISIIEGSLLSLVIRSSWSLYVRANRRAQHSLYDFLRKLSLIRKVKAV